MASAEMRVFVAADMDIYRRTHQEPTQKCLRINLGEKKLIKPLYGDLGLVFLFHPLCAALFYCS